jgi:Calcineurin-like phosphoesterase
MKLLILPDSHCHYEYDNSRFTALGRFIVDERPDVIINLGDMADMASLSSYDDGHASFEGRRFHKDIEVVIDANEKLKQPIKDWNRKTHKAYNPRMELTLGNHEYRIVRATELDPKLQGTISIDNLQYEKYGWNVHPFLEAVTVGGISFAHYFISGVASRPISGESIGRTMCSKLMASAVQGHSHVLDLAERTIITGNRVFGLSAGCFTHPDYVQDWCRASVRLWWRGIIILDDLDGNGYYDSISMITMRKLLREYL